MAGKNIEFFKRIITEKKRKEFRKDVRQDINDVRKVLVQTGPAPRKSKKLKVSGKQGARGLIELI